MIQFTLLSQELKTLVFHKEFSLKDINSHYHMINHNSIPGVISISVWTSMFIKEYSESLIVMISQEDSSLMKVLHLTLLKDILEIYLLTPEL